MGAELFLHNSQSSALGQLITIACLTDKTERVSGRVLDCYALVWVTQGRGRVSLGGGGWHPVETLDAFLLQPGQDHAYGPLPGQRWNELYVLFTGEVFELWRGQGLFDLERPCIRLAPEADWMQRFRGIHPDWTPLEQVCAWQQLLARAYRAPQRVEEDWLQPAQNLLARWRKESDAEQRVARELGMSYQSFRKQFRKRVGQPPGKFRRQLLLEEAARRLLTESISIKALAEELGFCDEYYFTRRFTEQHGIAPVAYRKRLQC